jgi:4-hydroxybenzoyl-CoA reductase subunit beta
VLRLPKFEVIKPRTAAEAVAACAAHAPGRALYLAGGTDLVPNMKHKLFEPEAVIALSAVEELHGIGETPAGGFRIGAMTTLTAVAAHAGLRARAAALAQAAGLVSGPQLRNMGTLGGNVMLDTRCRWYNQSHFWRKSLGYCLKKDGTVCHVVAGGSRCVAAASNDTAPALMTLDAELRFLGPAGARRMKLDELFQADGMWNKKVGPQDLLVEILVPPAPAGRRSAYGKLRERASIDFPQFGIAARLDLGADGRVAAAALAAVALQARPWRLRKTEALHGTTPGGADFDAAVEEVAAQAHKQCIPMDNVPGDAEYRRAMVPVVTRRTLRAAAADAGPAHPV